MYCNDELYTIYNEYDAKQCTPIAVLTKTLLQYVQVFITLYVVDFDNLYALSLRSSSCTACKVGDAFDCRIRGSYCELLPS